MRCADATSLSFSPPPPPPSRSPMRPTRRRRRQGHFLAPALIATPHSRCRFSFRLFAASSSISFSSSDFAFFADTPPDYVLFSR
jgi:hypothetical protein